MIRPFKEPEDADRMTNEELDLCSADLLMYDCAYVDEVDGHIKYVVAKNVRIRESDNTYVLINPECECMGNCGRTVPSFEILFCDECK